MADDDDFGFSTPRLDYLSLRKKFLSKHLDRNVWRVWLKRAAYCHFQFFEDTKKMAEESPELESDITIDNKNLVVQRILPFSPKLYEQVIAAAVGDDHQQPGQVWQQPASVIFAILFHSAFLTLVI